ncbi:MAG: hypothetical protein ACYDHH_23220 [Solirubrobacteraceae bacterium]
MSVTNPTLKFEAGVVVVLVDAGVEVLGVVVLDAGVLAALALCELLLLLPHAASTAASNTTPTIATPARPILDKATPLDGGKHELNTPCGP